MCRHDSGCSAVIGGVLLQLPVPCLTSTRWCWSLPTSLLGRVSWGALLRFYQSARCCAWGLEIIWLLIGLMLRLFISWTWYITDIWVVFSIWVKRGLFQLSIIWRGDPYVKRPLASTCSSNIVLSQVFDLSCNYRCFDSLDCCLDNCCDKNPSWPADYASIVKCTEQYDITPYHSSLYSHRRCRLFDPSHSKANGCTEWKANKVTTVGVRCGTKSDGAPEYDTLAHAHN